MIHFLRAILFLFTMSCVADPLPSWNDGKAKEAILKYVKEVTDPTHAKFLEVKKRIATFDQDGTLWVEKPFYAQLFFAIDRVKELAPQHPEWQDQEPFKAILNNDHEALSHLTEGDVEKIVAATHTGISIDEFHTIVNNWLKKAVHLRYKRPFTDLVYLPMLELMHYLEDNGFKVYIVTGGGQEFVRAYAERVYNLSPDRIIGTTGKVKYTNSDRPALIKEAEILFVDDKQGKPEGINLIIGARPYAAFGNSDGDREMLEWTHGHLKMLVHHDDPIREYAYDEKSKIGTFSASLKQEAEEKGWQIISIKNDWKTLFNFSN